MKKCSLILLSFALYSGIASGQDASVNRKKIIDMLLGQSRMNIKTDRASPVNIYSITPDAPAPQSLRTVSSIPKYCLAKGAVICRLEEYVQLHSPIKLNIGVGGE